MAGTELTDSELVKRLKELDYEPGPITDTTRSIYFKKLETLTKEKSKSAKRRLTAIHAMETSLDTSPRRSPRRTIHTSQPSTPVPGPSTQEVHPSNGNLNLSKQSTPKAKLANDDDDYNEFIRRTRSPRSRKSAGATTNPKTSITNRKSKEDSRLVNYSSPESSGDEEQMKNVSRGSMGTGKKLVTAPRLSTSVISSGPVARPPIRKSTRNIKMRQNNLSNFSDSETDQGTQNTVNRLLQLRPSSTASKRNLVDSDSGDDNYYASSQLSTHSHYNWISYALLIIIILFFVSIFSFYFYSRLNFSIFGAGGKNPIIDQLSQEIDSGLKIPYSPADSFCFSDENDARISLIILHEIKKSIDVNVYNYLCGEGFKEEKLRYSIKDLRQLVQRNIGTKLKEIISENKEKVKSMESEISRHVQNTLSLIHLNPQLKIIPIEDEYNGFIQLQVEPNSYDLNLPIKCRTYLFFLNYLPQIAITTFVILTSIGVYKYVHHRKRQAKEEDELVEELIEKSLELLQSPDEPGSMPVIHIRDSLLSPAERKMEKYKKAWNRAVAAIEAGESRVKVELENIDGEDFKAWRWIAMASLSPSPSNNHLNKSARIGSMEWQGKAFDGDEEVKKNQEDQLDATPGKKMDPGNVVGKNFVAPTRFLKVRNMFDQQSVRSVNDGWKMRIMNTILEKCSSESATGQHGLIHMSVDVSRDDEGLVYIKSDSISSASSAFNALHGWWYDRKLVSVRFLKEERYYQRFPEARSMNAPMSMV